ncbi:hypothetical protein ASE01_12690 [Nocardioides sp. Root190]|uniref:hypothetical protein n=1 Tax=Nocardioides sp. Root190 TaxID=1736488 RepID=UPI0007003369|nr:hypothetical protein [Nocardioides sp. Root190]KRB75905.1 hypothetical protein ASE01_12690 [Nocardioides sp. Root190]
MSEESGGRWVADPRIGWRVLLTATLPEAPDAGSVADHLTALAGRQSWPDPGAVRAAGSTALLRAALVAADPAPLLAGVAGRDLVLSAHHAAVDGLGLLRVLEATGPAPVTSGARGIGTRPAGAGLAATVVRRLGEAGLRPPATITPPDHPVTDAGDVMVEREVTGSLRTATLVHAAARAVVAHQAARGRTARHVAIAVGTTRQARTEDPVIRDHSALLRLRDVEAMDLAGVERALREAPAQTPPVATAARAWTPALDRVTATGLRMLAPRLGSTLLVSHLGEVTAPLVEGLAFHPVTAGGTGMSLGAVGLRGTTVLTLRARADTWTDNGLEQVLEAVISLL